MSAKHTPGPWFVFDHRSLNGAYWIGREQFETHAEVRGGCTEADEAGDMLANAHLIAAAPDLLETAIPALHELDVIIGLLMSEQTRAEMQAVADNLRAAIAKASA